MNWISENKFLSGFLGFMFVGVAVLGFFLYQEMGNYAAVHDKYTKELNNLQNLQNHKPYPNASNLEKYAKQEDELKGLIAELNQNIAQLQMPVDPTVTPQKFQASLQAAAKDTSEKAATANVQLPEKFALGFENYLTTPPVQAAAPGLDRQLKAIQFVIDQLLDGSGVDSISPVVRGALSEEDSKGNKPSTAPVIRVPVKITFVTNWVKLRTILNNLNQTKKQFYIVHLIDIDPPQGDDAKQLLLKQDAIKNRMDKDGHLKPAFGGEKILVTLSLEIVNFNLPSK